MKRGASFVAQRRESIERILRERKRIAVADLAEQLGVSALTIRRDLDYLEERGVAARRYGEALLAEGTGAPERTRLERAREAIARRAASLVHDRDSIFINTSATALSTIPFIEAQSVTVISNSGRILGINAAPTMTLLLTGGEVRAPRSVLSGPFALASIEAVSPVLAFMGCAGLTVGAGVTSLTLQEATVNALMFERSELQVLLTDSSKFGVEAGFRYAKTEDVDILITDTDAPAEVLDELRRCGVKEIIQVDPDEVA